MTKAMFGLLTCALTLGLDAGNDREAEGRKLYETSVRPVFVKTCWECHSAKVKAPKAGLRLDSRERLLKGGDSGPAIVSGKPNESLLIHVLEHSSEIAQMPPGSRLADRLIDDFRRWVALGAPYVDEPN